MTEQRPTTSADATPAAAAEAAPAGTSRREFMVGVGIKAAYITPVLLTLAATPAVASPHAVSCKPLAGSCSTNHDCCSNNCNNNLCI